MVRKYPMVDLRQSAAYAQYLQSLGWIVDQGIFIKPLGWFGAIAKIQRRDLPKNWRAITKKYHVWMTKWEPGTTPTKAPPPKIGGGWEGGIFGFRLDSWPLLATKTIKIDLTPTPEKILASFKKDARYCLRKSQNSKHKIQFNDFNNFYSLWKKSAGIKKLWTPPYKDYQNLINAFGQKCFCLTIDNLAGALILTHNNIAYYYFAGALPEGKQKYLQYLVVWQAMQKAKKIGCKLWDFEGIYDSRWPNKGWQGFSHFKRSFSGVEVDFPGSFTKWF